MTHKFYPTDAGGHVDGGVPRTDQFIIFTLALICRDIGQHAIEIGTFKGETATNIALAMPNHLVITVDIPPDQVPKFPVPDGDRKHTGQTPVFHPDVANRIEALRIDSALLELPKDVCLGFAFIDGAHTYEYAWNDFNKIQPRLVQGGIVVFHDVCGGVGHAVEEIMLKYPKWQWSAYQGTSLCWGVKR